MSELKPPETIWLLFNGENNPDGEWSWCEDADPTGDYREGEDSFKYQRQPHPDSEAIEESLRFWIATRINKASVSMASSGYENHDLVKAFDSVYESIQQAMEQEK